MDLAYTAWDDSRIGMGGWHPPFNREAIGIGGRGCYGWEDSWQLDLVYLLGMVKRRMKSSCRCEIVTVWWLMMVTIVLLYTCRVCVGLFLVFLGEWEIFCFTVFMWVSGKENECAIDLLDYALCNYIQSKFLWGFQRQLLRNSDGWFLSLNSLTPICLLAGTKNYPSVGFLRRNSMFFLVF